MHVVGKIEEDTQHQEVLEERSSEFHSNLIFKGKRDELSRIQPKSAPTLKVGDRTQCAFQPIKHKQDGKWSME